MEGYEVRVFDCKEMVFDPNTASCTYLEEPATDLLCNNWNNWFF